MQKEGETKRDRSWTLYFTHQLAITLQLPDLDQALARSQELHHRVQHLNLD